MKNYRPSNETERRAQEHLRNVGRLIRYHRKVDHVRQQQPQGERHENHRF